MNVKETNLLCTLNAYHNCIKTDNCEWQEKHWERIEQTLLGSLPHGSGIDCDWVFNVDGKYLCANNSYHVMNDNGMYCGYIDFIVKIKPDVRDMFGKIIFAIVGRFGKNQELKAYLYELIAESLNEL